MVVTGRALGCFRRLTKPKFMLVEILGANMATTTAEASSLAVPRAVDSAQAKLVYVYLEREREASVGALADALNLRKIDLFTVLSTLESAGAVEIDGVDAVRVTD